jgi:hypothetical protein
MRQTIHNILWSTLIVSVLTCDYFIYKSWTTEYDENVNNFALAALISFLNTALLIYLWRKSNSRSISIIFVKYFSLFLGTPITLTLLIIYINYIPMGFISSTYSTKPNRTYKADKYRNSFKATNILIDNNLSANPDTIVGIIDNDGNVIEVYRVKAGDTTDIKLSELTFLTDEQRKELLTY